MNQVFASWSGGKDSCLACYRALESGLEVRYLVNMITVDGKKSWTHGQSSELLRVQSQALGIPLIQRRATMSGYETEFRDVISELRRETITGGVFGDIDLEEHREWIERLCRKAEITPYLPLWGESQDKVLRDFVELGFEAVVVVAKADLFGKEILGRKVDSDLIGHLEALGKTKNVTPCGEAGEYHTFVIDGPLFHRRVEILKSRRVLRDKTWILEIVQAGVKAKE